MAALRHAGRPVPLIVLSACSGLDGADGGEGLAMALVARGADRVIAMQAPVTDTYATTLALDLYRELGRDPAVPVAQALARARQAVHTRLLREGHDKPGGVRPEYAVATLIAAGDDPGLVDPAASAQPLTRVVAVPAGGSVRDLAVGQLIGRRRELRHATAVLRRTPAAMDEHGAGGGVVLTGVGGIGKTALAGRVLARLGGDGWQTAVHDGAWNPTALFAAVADAVHPPGTPTPSDQPRAVAAALLRDPAVDDPTKLTAVERLLATRRLLVVLDDFEQNLGPGGLDWLDDSVADIVDRLAQAAAAPTGGALLITCRYPLPTVPGGAPPPLAGIAVPPLTSAELRRMFLRMPALRDLPADDRALITRSIGGHPRLIEFVDALMRGGRSNLAHLRGRLAGLASRQGVDWRQQRDVTAAAAQAVMLGAADILLEDLLGLLTPHQTGVLHQVAVSRAPMTHDDLAYALTGQQPTGPDADLARAVERLTDLTLLTPGPGIGMHPWTADLIIRNNGDLLDDQHDRALIMRMRRFQQGRGTYEDLVDIPRHQAHLHRYDDAADTAAQAVTLLPGMLAALAYLGEVRPLIPDTERAWLLVAEQEARVLLALGDLPAATHLTRRVHTQVQARAAADPSNTGWQRDLSVSHNKLGDFAVAGGDRAAAATHFQAALDIAARLAAADPSNTGWQRDLDLLRALVDDQTASRDKDGEQLSL
jgi:hypothetical protein